MVKEIKSHPITYLLLTAILVGGFVARVYRIGDNLGFYFDQGRDANIIWDLWKNGKFFLIGPTTGIAGIFRGPFYYYLIAPFYILGGGSPVWPSVFLSTTTIMAVGILYYLGYKFQNRITGLIAATIGAFSFNIVLASRWLSNPTPMFFISMALVWMMYLVHEKKKWAWIGIAFLSGLSLFHFGSSGEFFYFPALALFALWQRKNLPDKRVLLFSALAFIITFLPQVVFDIRHEGILRNNIQEFLTQEESFVLPNKRHVKDKFELYYDVFTNKIFDARQGTQLNLIYLVGLSLLLFLPRLKDKLGVKILGLLFLAPIVGFLFFRGNFGIVYDYYFTGYYFVFMLLFAIVLGYLWKYWWGKLFVVYFLFAFLQYNLPLISQRYKAKATGEQTIVLENQLQAVDWVYKDAGAREFNVDVYVPPVIPHAYDYLFKWYGIKEYNRQPSGELIELLYTLEEVDSPHPDRVEKWRARQSGIGKIEEEVKFGGIIVQRRTRI